MYRLSLKFLIILGMLTKFIINEIYLKKFLAKDI